LPRCVAGKIFDRHRRLGLDKAKRSLIFAA
jgi:hypothetical protein